MILHGLIGGAEKEEIILKSSFINVEFQEEFYDVRCLYEFFGYESAH